MKKILLINWRDIRNPEAGGAEIYYHEIFRRIAAKGYSVTVLSHRFPGAPLREEVDGTTVIRHGSKFLFNFAIVPFLLRRAREFDLVIEDLNKIPFFTPLFILQQRLHLAMHFFGVEIFREALFPAALYVFLMEKLAGLLYRNERFVAGGIGGRRGEDHLGPGTRYGDAHPDAEYKNKKRLHGFDSSCT